MLRYSEVRITFSEVPNEISLTISICGCPNRCPGCHSPHLWKDEGDILTADKLRSLILKNDGITCVCLLGGDADKDSVAELVKMVKTEFTLKTCWYSGRELKNAGKTLPYLDFIKTGPYIEDLGPLNAIDTNQTFYEIKNIDGLLVFENKTYLFQK